MYRYYYFNNNGQDDYGFKGVDDCGNAWKCNKYKFEFPMQSQDVQPGMEYLMVPRPIFDNPEYKAMVVNEVLTKFKDKKIVSASGMAGFYSNNIIETRKLNSRF